MAPLVDFFDHPLLRRFLLTVIVLMASWFLLELVFSRTFDGWSSAAWFEVIYFIPLVWFLVAKTHRESFAVIFRGLSVGSFRWFHLLVALGLGLVASFGIDNLMSMVVAMFAPDYIEESLNMQVIEVDSHWLYNVWMVLGAVVVAPFMEELVFRGLLFERLSRKWNIRRAALISSLIFGLLHAEAWLGAALFGLLMCIVYHHTKNLWMPIIVHIANNLVSVLLMYFTNNTETTLVDWWEDWPYFVTALLVLPGLYYFIKRYFPPEQSALPYRSNVHTLS